MGDPPKPQRDGASCERVPPTGRIPPLGDIFRDLARARERSLNSIAGAVGQTLKDAVAALPGGKSMADGIAAAGRSIADGSAPPPVALAPSGASPEQEFAHYERILQARGFILHPTEPTALAIRGQHDVTMLVLRRDAQGDPLVITLDGPTLAGAPTEEHQVRRLDPGEYLLSGGANHAGAEVWMPTFDTGGRVPGTGDMNPESPAWERANSGAAQGQPTVPALRAAKLIVLDADDR